jgi:putative transposase
MRRERLTYPGAFHHVMNRGIKGEYIFPGDKDKEILLEHLSKRAAILGIRIIGYCLMNNHYHLLLENISGRMSGLLKQVNGAYGIYYRRKHGGKGYVFQNRFSHTMISCAWRATKLSSVTIPTLDYFNGLPILSKT